MARPIVRFERISIDNLKNVGHGEISFSNPRRPEGASVLGMYGQNGSGKSTLIDALEMVQGCMEGRRLNRRFAQLVSVGADYGAVECELSVSQPDGSNLYRVLYSFKVKSDVAEPDETESKSEEKSEERFVLRVFDERLAVANDSPGKKSRMTTLIDTSGGGAFGPVAKYKQLIGKDPEDSVELTVEKRLAYRESRSFIFSKKLGQTIYEKHKDEEERSQGVVDTLSTISDLGRFSGIQMFVLNTRDAGMLALDALPFPFRVVGGEKITGGGALLPMRGTETIPERVYEPVNAAIENMDVVLRELIPGLVVSLNKLGTEVMKNGETGVNVQLVSVRNGRTIPLSCESEGIKRIVSFLHLLILMFNDPSVTVVIDEIDSGVFEYLLGELLGIVSEHGQGQLIFTCHNLRPLETIDRGFVAFTTTNPNKRYTRMANVKSSNNLRDFYYRDIILGGQREQLYEPTHNGEIELAFIEACVAGEE